VEHPQISETFPDLVPLLRSGREETFAACELVSQYAEDIMLESDNIQEYEDRLYAFRDLARKHKTEPQLLVDLIPSLQQQAQNLKDIEHQEEILKEKVEEAKKHYLHLAQGISQKRKDAALRLSDTVHRELALLDMPKARFHVEITPLSLEKCGAFGLEQVSFLLATNPHHKPASLAKIASGGELNRLLLAIQSGLASRHLYPSMIFDEIDSGIGGKTAAILAQRLAWLAQTSQILAVTHAPQVAAYGEHHFFVAKDEKSSSTTVSLLSPSERVEDIARMISGTTINESARHAAEKLILEAKTLSPVKKRLSS
jgi:DNA repair protein RecN (Recombination protein N)